MRRYHERHMGSPCRSVFILISIMSPRLNACIHTFLSSLFQFFFDGRLIFNNWRYSIKSNPFVSITSAATAENYKKNHVYFLTYTLPTSAFVNICLSTNEADSNCSGWKPRMDFGKNVKT